MRTAYAGRKSCQGRWTKRLPGWRRSIIAAGSAGWTGRLEKIHESNAKHCVRAYQLHSDPCGRMKVRSAECGVRSSGGNFSASLRSIPRLLRRLCRDMVFVNCLRPDAWGRILPPAVRDTGRRSPSEQRSVASGSAARRLL